MVARPLGACWITRRPCVDVSSWMGLTTMPPCWTTWDSIILSLSMEVSPTRVFPLTSLMTLVAGGSSADPAVVWVAIISILFPPASETVVVRRPFFVPLAVVPLISSLPLLTTAEAGRGKAVVVAPVPLVLDVPMICSPDAVLVMSPFCGTE